MAATKAKAKRAATSASVAAWAGAFTDATRLRILRGLALHGERCVGDIADAAGVEMVNASHHLGVLRAAGLVAGRKSGRRVLYSAGPGVAASGGRVTAASPCGASITF